MAKARHRQDPDYGVDVPSPVLAALRAGKVVPRDREWTVPTVMALALTNSIWAAVIQQRRQRGLRPNDDVQVLRIDGRLYASVTFAGALNDLFFPLDRLNTWSAR